MNNRDSLRTQIIESMVAYHKEMGGNVKLQSAIFDNAIMPVLNKAMEAGELLVHRATTPQKPINQAIVDWLEDACVVLARVRDNESTLSRRKLLEILYDLEKNANVAVADARHVRNQQEAQGKLLSGVTIPTKG